MENCYMCVRSFSDKIYIPILYSCFTGMKKVNCHTSYKNHYEKEINYNDNYKGCEQGSITCSLLIHWGVQFSIKTVALNK